MMDANNNEACGFPNNLSAVLSSFQQNEEFVDMTLAADGQLVKVHQMVMACSSPYLKNLIQSAPGGHPIIHLTGVSSEVLKCMLEYIYRGETQVTIENFPKFWLAAQDLHLKGMAVKPVDNCGPPDSSNEPAPPNNKSRKKRRRGPRRSAKPKQTTQPQEENIEQPQQNGSAVEPESAPANPDYDEVIPDTNEEDTADVLTRTALNDIALILGHARLATIGKNELRYTLSSSGGLQLVLDRYMYTLKYQNPRGVIRWRCREYHSKRCGATVTTKKRTILKKRTEHNHVSHANSIMNKIMTGRIYRSMNAAAQAALLMN